MPIAVRHRDVSPLPLSPLPQLHVLRERDSSLMAELQKAPETDIIERFAQGHHAYVAWFAGWPAGWGWLATRVAEIGEVRSSFAIPARERYLWNFVTLPSHRGKGIYPRMLQSIVQVEARDVDRFWIAYAPENAASGAGIRKAGFIDVAELSFDAERRPALRALAEGADAAARLLGLPLVDDRLSPCWHCARRASDAAAGCTDDVCTCDYQKLRAAV